MRILMVSSYLPYPLFSGGHIRLYNLMKQLKEKRYEITLICEKRNFQSEDDIKNVSGVCDKVIVVDRKKQWSPQNIIKSAFSSDSFLTIGHRLPKMKKAIEDELAKEKYDLIHVETFYVFQNLPKTDLPTVLVEHNVEYLVYKRYSEKAPIFVRPLLNLDVLKMKNEEKKFWKTATRLVAVSREEKEIMKREDTAIVPNGVDVEKFDIRRIRKKKNEEIKILFIGDFKWIQNRDAAEWIINNIWPKVLDRFSNQDYKVKLWIVGKRIPQYLKNMGGKTIYFDENAPSRTELIYKDADVLLAPIRIGGGTSFKILESMASGLPVITTPLGNEGIDAKPGRDILIAQDPQQYAIYIADLIEDERKYKKLSENSKDFIENNFDWKKISVVLEKVYKSAVSK